MTQPHDDVPADRPAGEARVLAARNGTLAVFAANGFAMASWMSRLPDVRERFDLTPGALSVLLFAISLGALVGLPIAGRVSQRLGVVRAAQLGVAVASAGLLWAATATLWAPSHLWIAPGLVAFGLGNGVWDVAQNLEGGIVEQAVGRAIMPWFHAAYSGGTVVGAFVGAGIIALGIPTVVHVVVTTLLATAFAGVAAGRFLPAGAMEEHAEGTVVRSAWTEPRTLLVGVMVLAAAFAEGTANDWMAVAFVSGHGLPAHLGVLIMGLFLTAMTLTRVLGTHVLDRYGRVPVLGALFTAAAIGSLMVCLGSLPVAIVGAAVWGCGASLGFPVGMSAASDDPSQAPARLSVVSTLGYTAFLGGPPLIGFLGDHVGVLRALLAVGAASLAALLVLPAARPEGQEAATR
ncbi:MFS transporter [Mobilicoccus pelagius]|uniref:Putative major facilitator superfamily transporter n=1 Tax=Mobilicoccus pelagius NBRC 104925 TaxID=1089455 RepID=H5UPN4_9MICO|nr:MFS transporter [Mobilicoccus pelagius]GAB47692.1 putative major facilitator superfamily transporter [Mobilicoccus pelagius NBRC 104925]